MAVLLLLAVVWAAVLLPPLARRQLRRRAEKVVLRRMEMRLVGPSTAPSHHPGPVRQAPIRRSRPQRRRRVIAGIAGLVLATLGVAVVVGSRVAWGAHLLSIDLLIAYVGLLARAGNARARRSRAPARHYQWGTPAPVLRPAASGL